MMSGGGRKSDTSSPLNILIGNDSLGYLTCQGNGLADALPCKITSFSIMFMSIKGTNSGRSVTVTFALE